LDTKSREPLEDTLDPELMDESGEIRVQNIQFQTYAEAPRSKMNHLTKRSGPLALIKPWKCGYCRVPVARPVPEALIFDAWLLLDDSQLSMPINTAFNGNNSREESSS